MQRWWKQNGLLEDKGNGVHRPQDNQYSPADFQYDLASRNGGMRGNSIRDMRLEIHPDRPWALKVLESLLNERDAAYEGEIPRCHSAATDRVATRRSNITVVQSRAPPVQPFDSHKCLLAILNDRPYISHERPDDAPTLNACEWDRCFPSTALRKSRYDDRKATAERNILCHNMRQNPYHKREDWEDFMQSKRNSEIRHQIQ
ncbi:hypothetical protein ARMGADRAFT_1166886 [Armillaria gallica]|uniref:Uncharacterized protein n=1 Tax=Armillaria gallica TaxID=47427 RepID=A0A2H3DGE5_ARMGA|nr:hypothetical protein ARMGADRAFT_1166886 [Armillaria gallica]